MQAGLGEGVIISPKDLAFDKAKQYAKKYRDLGKGVLLDPQYYDPEFAAGKLETWPISEFRQSIGGLSALPSSICSDLARAIEKENRELGCDAVIAPAIPYEAARPEIIALNARLFEIAKNAGDAIGIPTYATVVIGRSATTVEVVEGILSGATTLEADGWYYGFEIDGQQRLPTGIDVVYRYCLAGLTLACSGKGVLHAYSGPLANIAYGAGARAVGIGIWQNLWGFKRTKFQVTAEQGGGGEAPPRYFSGVLWGTIVYPDEVVQLSKRISKSFSSQILQPSSPYSPSSSAITWSKWESRKHMVYIIASMTNRLAQMADARRAMEAAVAALETASMFHQQIVAAGIQLKDETDAYQSSWAAAGKKLLTEHSKDYDWLELCGGP
jgi:hypothetical protein